MPIGFNPNMGFNRYQQVQKAQTPTQNVTANQANPFNLVGLNPNTNPTSPFNLYNLPTDEQIENTVNPMDPYNFMLRTQTQKAKSFLDPLNLTGRAEKEAKEAAENAEKDPEAETPPPKSYSAIATAQLKQANLIAPNNQNNTFMGQIGKMFGFNA